MRFLDAARQELDEGALWYEARDRGLGERFLGDVEQRLDLIKKNPAIGAQWEVRDVPAQVVVRRVPLRKFPYLIVYVLEPELTVVAIAHGRRKPGYWSDRL